MSALWDAFLNFLADRLLDLAERFGPGLFAFFTENGAA